MLLRLTNFARDQLKLLWLFQSPQNVKNYADLPLIISSAAVQGHGAERAERRERSRE